MDLIMSPKVKTMKGKGVRVHFLAHNTLMVEGHARAPRWGLGKLTSNSIIQTNLYKPNNKFVSG
jgi:hypothetical protein